MLSCMVLIKPLTPFKVTTCFITVGHKEHGYTYSKGFLKLNPDNSYHQWKQNCLRQISRKLSMPTIVEGTNDNNDYNFVTGLKVIQSSNALSLVYTYDASISISTRNLRVNRCDASISALCLLLCLCLRRSGLHVRRNDANITPAQENGTISILFCLCLCLRRSVVRVNRDDTNISTSTRKGN